jgi:TolA-binding protein
VDNHRDHEAWNPSLLRLGDALGAVQNWQRSEAMFRRSLKEIPDSPTWYQAQFGVGFALQNQKRYDEAIEAYRAVIGRHEGSTAARAQFQVGECLFAQRRFDDAVRELLRVDILYAYPEWSAPALYEAGRCFVELGDTVSARKQFEQVQARYGETEWAPLAADRLEDLAAPALPGQRP